MYVKSLDYGIISTKAALKKIQLQNNIEINSKPP